MGGRVADFMSDWVSENVHFAGYPSEDETDPEAESLAMQCLAAAEADGIPKDDLEREYGDLSSFMREQLKRVADEEVAAMVARDD